MASVRLFHRSNAIPDRNQADRTRRVWVPARCPRDSTKTQLLSVKMMDPDFFSFFFFGFSALNPSPWHPVSIWMFFTDLMLSRLAIKQIGLGRTRVTLRWLCNSSFHFQVTSALFRKVPMKVKTCGLDRRPAIGPTHSSTAVWREYTTSALIPPSTLI